MKIRSQHPRITQKISELSRRYPMVNHALISGLIAQHFSIEQMHGIGERFYHVIKNFPRFLAAMISHWDDTNARMPLVENLFEEHGRMDMHKVHVHTYVDFLRQMGMDHERVTSSKPTPSTIAYFNSVMHLCTHNHPNQGLGALAYIEDIVHQVSAIFGGAVKRERAHVEHVSHFSEHEVLDDQHSQEIYDMLDMSTPEAIEHALFGITMGAFHHHQLYETILAEVLYESGDNAPTQFAAPIKTMQAEYPLQTGDAGKKRLDILNALYNEQSLSFITKHASVAGARFLEVGCGTGKLSYDLAIRRPEFSLLAVDNAHAQIELAKTSWPHLPNLVFSAHHIEQLSKTSQSFDVIYLRWVLIYQKDLLSLVKCLASLLTPTGCLLIEDNEPGYSGCFSASHQRAIDHWQNFWTRGVSMIGQGEGFSTRLIDAAKQCGLSLNDIGINQQLLRTDEEKELFMLGVWESKDAILGAGVLQSVFDEIYQNAASIKESPAPVGFVRNIQMCFNKPRISTT